MKGSHFFPPAILEKNIFICGGSSIHVGSRIKFEKYLSVEYVLHKRTFFTMVVSLGSTLAFFASGPSLEFPVGFTSLGFSLKTE